MNGNALKTGLASIMYYFIGPPFLCILIPILVKYWSKRLFSVRDKLRGKVVLITGASSGLGEALSHELYKQGCKVILAARRLDQLERVKSDLEALSCQYETFTPEIVQMNLADTESLQSAADEVLKIYGRVDILINNAGISFRGSVLSTEISVHEEIMTVNYFGTIALTKGLLPAMVNGKGGQIVMINSIQGKIGLPYRSAYCASKHALQGYADGLRAEIKKFGINVITISAGYIKTMLSTNALKGDGSRYALMDKTTSEGYPPQYVARKIVEAIKSDKKEVIISPLSPKLAIIIRAILPDLYFLLMERRANDTTIV